MAYKILRPPDSVIAKMIKLKKPECLVIPSKGFPFAFEVKNN